MSFFWALFIVLYTYWKLLPIFQSCWYLFVQGCYLVLLSLHSRITTFLDLVCSTPLNAITFAKLVDIFILYSSYIKLNMCMADCTLFMSLHMMNWPLQKKKRPVFILTPLDCCKPTHSLSNSFWGWWKSPLPSKKKKYIYVL